MATNRLKMHKDAWRPLNKEIKRAVKCCRVGGGLYSSFAYFSGT